MPASPFAKLAGAAAVLCSVLAAQDLALRTFGNGVGDIDRIKIRIDDPNTTLPGPPADVGASDFTIEFWVKGTRAENRQPAVQCGFDVSWIDGNIVIDRDRFNQGRKFGISFGAGRVAFGVTGPGTGDRTLCGSSDVLDGLWHHVAVQRRRSDGFLWIFVDGRLESSGDGPDGDVSYPDDGVPGNFCNGPCVHSDPFLVFAAEKHDAGPAYPSFSGWLDEVRLSHTLRYAGPFARPTAPFAPDAATAALYHCDESSGTALVDAMGASPGERRFGGSPAGPLYGTDTPFTGSCASLALRRDPQVGVGVSIALDAPCQAGATYALAAALGTVPGIPVDLRRIPLNADPLFALSLAVPSVFSGFVGTLDASGRATATVNVIPPLAGATFYLAAITLEAAAPSGIGAITGALPFRVP
jgi:hypothetical protein